MLPALIRRSTSIQSIHSITSITSPMAHRSTEEPRGAAPPREETYVGAFARVRLVRAWIGAAAAMVALGYAFAALLDRVLP